MSIRSLFGTTLSIAMALVLLSALAGGAWLVATGDGMRWALARAEAASEGRLSIEAPAGTLLGGITASRIAYRDAALTLRAQKPALELKWWSLLRGALNLRSIAAQELVLEFPAGGESPPVPPDSLALPLRFGVDRFELDRVTLVQGGARNVLTRVAGSIASGRSRHSLSLENLQLADLRASGTLAIAVQPPFAVQGQVDVLLDTATGPLNVGVRAGGILAKLELALRAHAQGAVAEGLAQIAPFSADWLETARLELKSLDAAGLDARAPRTDLRAALIASGGAGGRLQGTLAIDNAVPGPLSARRLPIASLRSRVDVSSGIVSLEDLRVDLGAAGRLHGEATLDGVRSRAALQVDRLDLRAVHASLRATKLAGSLAAALDAAGPRLDVGLRDALVAIEARLHVSQERVRVERLRATARGGEITGSGELARTGPGRFRAELSARGFDPASFGDWPQAALNGTMVATGQLARDWRAAVRIDVTNSRLRKVPLEARASFDVLPDSLRAVSADLRVGSNSLRARGQFGGPDDTLALELDAGNMTQLDPRVSGRLRAQAQLSGPLQRLRGRVEARGRDLAFAGRYRAGTLELTGTVSADEDRKVDARLELSALRIAQLALDAARVTVSGRGSAHEIEAQARGSGVDARARFAGAWLADAGWRGELRELQNKGAIPASLRAAAPLEAAPGRVVLGPAAFRMLEGELVVQALRWERGRFASSGRMDAFPSAPLLALAGVKLAPGADLALKAQWSIAAEPHMSGTLRIERDAGDLILSAEPRFAAGISTLALDARFGAERVDLSARLDAAQLGSMRAQARIDAPAGTADIASARSRLSGTIDLAVPTLAPVHAFIGSAAAVDGRAQARLLLGGSLDAPTLTGTARASGIRVDMPRHALELRDGQLDLALDERSLIVESLSIRGPEGILRASGSMQRADGESRLDWRADKLRVFNRPDRELVLSGAGTMRFTQARIVLRGTLRADQGYLEYKDSEADRLGDDVVIVGRRASAAGPAQRALPLDLDMTLDTGERFRVRVQGLDTALRGRVRVRSVDDGSIAAAGAIRTHGGSFRAYGQALSIERGELRFDGPISNPVLDVVALRKNQAVEAGVQVSGAVRSPNVRLTSNPPVPDHEKLSWLLLGRGAASADGAEVALLQAVAGTLDGSGKDPTLTQRLARDLGLDEVGLRGGLGGHVVAFGKRLSERLYFEYEQGLSVAATLVRLKFRLTQTLNVSAEAGAQGGGLGINYGRSYD